MYNEIIFENPICLKFNIFSNILSKMDELYTIKHECVLKPKILNFEPEWKCGSNLKY